MKNQNRPIQSLVNSDQSALNKDQAEESSLTNSERDVEVEENVEGYRLLFCQVGDAPRNSLNPCSKLPWQIRREQFISLCADIWRRHLDEATKEREIIKVENFEDNS